MGEKEQQPQDDERGSQPPAEGGDAEEGSGGPAGNPAQDEEALSHRQQEQDGSEGE